MKILDIDCVYLELHTNSITNTTFRKQDMCQSSSLERETATLLDPSERGNLNNWTTVSETLRFLVFRIPDYGQSSETE
jgi:hypothetical protein